MRVGACAMRVIIVTVLLMMGKSWDEVGDRLFKLQYCWLRLAAFGLRSVVRLWLVGRYRRMLRLASL